MPFRSDERHFFGGNYCHSLKMDNKANPGTIIDHFIPERP